MPVGAAAFALHTMACISYVEKLAGHRNPEIKMTGFSYQNDSDLPKEMNKTLEDCVNFCRMGVQAGVDYERGNFPDFGTLTEPLGIQPLANSVEGARALISQAVDLAKKTSKSFRSYEDKRKCFERFSNGQPWEPYHK